MSNQCIRVSTRTERCEVVKPCVHVTATFVGNPMKVTTSLVCGAGSSVWALLVDEGCLIVEHNGTDAYVLVKKR